MVVEETLGVLGKADFSGTYEHNLDSKGRLTLPSTFRKLNPGVKSFKVSVSPMVINRLARGVKPSADYRPIQALNVFTDEGFDDYVKENFGGQGYRPRNPKDLKLKRFLLGNTYPVDLDSAGRIILPAKLTEMVRMRKEVVIVGMGEHFEIWDSEDFKFIEDDTLYDAYDSYLVDE